MAGGEVLRFGLAGVGGRRRAQAALHPGLDVHCGPGVLAFGQEIVAGPLLCFEAAGVVGEQALVGLAPERDELGRKLPAGRLERLGALGQHKEERVPVLTGRGVEEVERQGGADVVARVVAEAGPGAVAGVAGRFEVAQGPAPGRVGFGPVGDESADRDVEARLRVMPLALKPERAVRAVSEVRNGRVIPQAFERQVRRLALVGLDDGLLALGGAFGPLGAVLSVAAPLFLDFLEAAALVALAANLRVGGAAASRAGQDLRLVGVGAEGEADVHLPRGEVQAGEVLAPLAGRMPGAPPGGDEPAGTLPDLEEVANGEGVVGLSRLGILCVVGADGRVLSHNTTVL